jgi:general secretion pathway protein D
MANDTAYEWLLTILKRLDMPIEGGGDGRVHVYYCEHANCDELAATLSAITGVSVVGGGARRSTRPGAPGAPAPTPVPTGAPGQQGANSLLFEGEVRMAFDSPTNSLLVFSSLKDFQALRKVIEKLDSPRKQVYVEAMVLEVLLDKTRDTGVAYHGGIPTTIGGKETLILGGFDANKTLSPAGLVTDLGGLSGALFGPLLNQATSRIFGTNLDIPSFGAFIKLLQSNNDVNVLQLPNLLIMNNQEGEFKVGQNLPFPGGFLGGFGGGIPGLGGQAGGLGGFGFPSVSVQRQDVALQIKLIPSVNEHNMIRLDVDVEISDVASQNYNGMGPATSKRTVKTQVVCKDQQTVVTGGIIADRQSESTKKIPILGDIPLIGFFFRNRHVEMQKTNILIALTPYVISDMADLQRVAEKKMRERRDFLERYSAFEDNAKFEANIDYRRKRGMFEEMNTFAREIDEEEEQLLNIRKRDLENETMPLEPSPRRGGPGDKPEKGPGASDAERGKQGPEGTPAGKNAAGDDAPLLPTGAPAASMPESGAPPVALTRRR